jgi:murein DD-endopeptidase MepM/ murein hydrolase activator NlpD
MTAARAMSWVTITVCVVLLLCSGLVGAVSGGTGVGAAGCALPAIRGPVITIPASAAPAGGLGPVGQWDTEQVGNAAAIIAAGARRQIPPRGWVIALATAMQESTLTNLPGGDQDSVGLFQQRPSQGWGTPAQLQDPTHAAGAFYDKLSTIRGWQTMPLTDAAQAVQRSAHPDAYAQWEPEATALVRHLNGAGGEPAACAASVNARGWTPPLRGPVGSGFRTADRPGHDGVDISVPKGVPIHAAAAGVVSRTRCNAVHTATGAGYGCDRDGHPDTVRGCGWYVDITHTDNVITRYCHMLTRPAVAAGQHVAAGQLIGLVGSSGRSSGPHLHYEVHLGDPSPATATDPVAFMAAVGAPLG